MSLEDIFSTFVKPLQRVIREKGFPSPTEPQRQAIPLIMQGKNVLLVAPTGTGKTEAAFLPVFNAIYLMAEREPGIKAIYVTPLRALNRNLLERLEWWCKNLDIRIAVRHGDTEIRDRGRQALVPPDVLITTPETLQAILPGFLMRKNMMSVRFVIIDEVHELADDKRGSQLVVALERLRELLTGDLQVIGLSATIGTPERVAEFLVGRDRGCEVVKVPVPRSMRLEIMYPEASEEDYRLASKLLTYPDVAARLGIIRELVQGHQAVLIFTNTRSEAEILANRFRIWDIDYPIGLHHGSLSKPSRVNTETQLKEGRLHGVICTSSLEMGIDIGSLDLVIQYNSPRQVTRLMQRVGRSGHRVEGIARGVIITQDSDDTLESMVVARRAYEEMMEPVAVPKIPLDVLAHQIAGMIIHRREWNVDDLHETIARANPYVELQRRDLLKVLEYMNSRYPRTVWLSEDKTQIKKPLNAKMLYKYYFDNLSMIPDEKQYLVMREDDKTAIGVLDEAFVAEHAEMGTKFVEGGSVWKIVQVYLNKIYVVPEEDPTGAIPSWVGEEIPVPLEIAREVGEIRRTVEERLTRQQASMGETVDEICERYPVKRASAERALKEIGEQVGKRLPVPTERRVTIEKWEGYLIINCCFGHLVNRTLGRLLAHLISEKTGTGVGIQQDPYRIVIKSPATAPADVRSLLLAMNKEAGDRNYDEDRNIAELSLSALAKTGTFKRRIMHVAKKFGAISKDVDITSVNLNSMIEAFSDTAIFEEAVRTVLRLDSDMANTIRILRMIGRGEIEVVTIQSDQMTPITRIGMEKIGRRSDLIPPQRMQKILLESAKARLLSEARTLVCTECWDHIWTAPVKDLMNDLKCRRCGSGKIGLTGETEQRCLVLSEKVHSRTAELPKNYRRLFRNLAASADLVSRYGFPAAVALAGKNIPLSDVQKLLEKQRSFNDAFVDSVMKAERKALRRRYFG